MAERSRRLPRGIQLPEPDPEKETLEHFEKFCWMLPDPNSTNGRFKLEEFQLGPLEDYFAGGAVAEFFQHFWSWPTGNGKSTLFGALALHHGTYCVRLPRVFVVGGELEHAKNTTNAAAAFVLEARRRGNVFGFWWEPQEYAGGRLIPMWLDNPDVGIFCRTAGRRTEHSGGSSVEGKDPSLIIVEELHRHSDNGSAVSVLIAKTVKAEARHATVKVLIGTTRGTDQGGFLGRLEGMVLDEDTAQIETDLRPGEYYTRAIDEDRETVAHIWAVPEEINPPPLNQNSGPELDEYLEHVEKASPASWITVKALRRVWKTLGRLLRWQFIRQNANQWVTAGIGAIERAQWWSLKNPDLKLPEGPGIQVVVGLDRAYKWDNTALIPVWRSPGGKYLCGGAVILDPKEGGAQRRTREVGTILEMMRQRWPDMIVAFDRSQGGGDVAEELEEDHGVAIVDHDQGKEFELACMKTAEVVENKKLEHDGHSGLATHVLNTIARPVGVSGKRWRAEKPSESSRIDGFDGLAMAINVSSKLPLKKKIGAADGEKDDYHVEQL